MFSEVFYNYIKTNTTFNGSTFRYGNAIGETPPYVVMIKILDDEEKLILPVEQGYQGKCLFQFSFYDTTDQGSAEDAFEAIKKQIATYKGVIGTTPDQYRITHNRTTGIRAIGTGESLNTQNYGAMFETRIWWQKI